MYVVELEGVDNYQVCWLFYFVFLVVDVGYVGGVGFVVG